MAIIESYVKPLRLYRYRNQSDLDREIEAIQEGYLYCAHYMDMNDPMEGRFTSSRLVRKSKNYRTFKNTITDQKAQLGICSFSEVYDNELMWAHYAGKYKGICIAYSLSRLLDRLGREVTFVRMYYNEDEPTIRPTRKEPEKLAKMVLSYKNYRWLHEREWRMFARPGKVYYGDTACVTRVYLGSEMGSNDRERLTAVLNGLNIKIYFMNIDKYPISFTSRSLS